MEYYKKKEGHEGVEEAEIPRKRGSPARDDPPEDRCKPENKTDLDPDEERSGTDYEQRAYLIHSLEETFDRERNEDADQGEIDRGEVPAQLVRR
jgi:hypothetical protein